MKPTELSDDPVRLSPRDAGVVRQLVPYLRQRLGLAGPVEVKRFPGGRANLTYLVVAGDKELVVRRPPFGPLPPRAHDMEREHRVMSALSTKLPFVPRTLHLCADRSVMGVPFFVMERVHGFVLREAWPAFLPDDPLLRLQITQSFLSVMVELHALDPADVGLESLGRPEGFMERQLKSWAERWYTSATEKEPKAERVLAWLETQKTPPQPPSIIHNDLKLDNVMLDWDAPGRVRAVFDWDMSTLGDPLADMALVLTYWGQPGDDPQRYGGQLPVSVLEGFPDRAWLVEQYAQRTGRDLSGIRFYQVFGLVKLAVLCQQLLQRYREGGSEDTRLMVYETQVPAIWREAHRLVQNSRSP